MWITRRAAETLARMIGSELRQPELVAALASASAVVADLHVALAQNAELRSQLAVSRANFDWLATRVNDLSLERAEIYRRLGIFVPVPEIGRVPTLAGADDGYTPTSPAPLGDLLNAARDLKEQAMKPPPADGGELSFEDIGDDRAGALGIERDPDTGEVVFKR